MGFIQSKGLETFAQPRDTKLPVVLGLHANPGFSILSIVVGAIVVLACVIGRNVDRWVNLIAGAVFILAGMIGLVLMRTDLNFFGDTMATVIVSFVLGLIMFTAGLYGRVGSVEQEAAEAHRREGGQPVDA
ncbi:DUF4383 domain-containing protein [Stackebrandtia sp.]|uniref:DUF4383 domain-containing protein n=1 Tax=Stackebrandtia sp. TaxID=2023065 RepID=UPI0039C9D17F